MTELCQPHSKVLRHCMDDIICTVSFDDVMLKLLHNHDIITLEESQWLPKRDNKDAVVYVVDKVIHSTFAEYLKFQEVLTKMEQPQYTELSNKLTSEYERAKSYSEVVLVQNATTEFHVQLTCSESVGGDINALSSSYESIGGDINTRSWNFSSYFESDGNNNNIEEVLDYIHEVLKSAQQTTPEPVTNKIKLKTDVGKTFTVFLIYFCNVFIKAVDKEGVNLVRNSESHGQYIMIITEVNDSIKILMDIKDKFCSVQTDQEQKDDLLQYVLLPILLGRANKTTEIIRNICSQIFQENRSDTLLSICDGIAQVVNGIKDMDCRPICELISGIQQLRARMDNIDTSIAGEALAWTSIQMGLDTFIRKVVNDAVDQSIEKRLRSNEEDSDSQEEQ